MSRLDPNSEKCERPVEVKEIAQFLGIYCVIWSIGGVFVVAGYFVHITPFGIPELLFGIVFFALAIFDGALALAFYHLMPWSYSVVKALLPLHRGAYLLGAETKINKDSVRHAFEQKQASEKRER